MTRRTGAPRARLRATIALFLLIVVGALVLPLASYVVTDVVRPALAQGQAASQSGGMAQDEAVSQSGRSADKENPRAEFWRGVRDSAPGYTAASGPYTTDVFIQNGGQNFRGIRNGPEAGLLPWVLAGVLAAIALFHFLVGPQKVKGPVSGRMMKRWAFAERVLHWYVAVLFIAMGITGLSLLFGRAVLIPVFGMSAYGAYAAFAKAFHNYVGPFFMAGVIVEVVVWMRYNLFNREDLEWLARLGGMFGGKHPHAGRANGGEKVWFWFIAIAGLVGVCITGLILDFPNFGQSRETMQIAQIVHGVLATLWVAIAFGHIYLGVWGTPGALEGMTQGHVTEEWMRLHHDRWYETVKTEGRQEDAAGLPAPEGSPARAR